MCAKILTYSITDIDTFMRDPFGVLQSAKSGITAIFANNLPAFYAITSTRLEQLLELEKRLARPESDVMLNAHLFEEPVAQPDIPIGKFTMYSGWRPDEDFQRQTALWGIVLTQPITPGELAAFISWWQAEGKVFTHIQWQQKLARSVQIRRANSGRKPKHDINAFSQPDTQIPDGFRGAK